MPDRDELFYKKKSAYDTAAGDEVERAYAYCEEYKQWLNSVKTEREFVAEAIKLASARGFLPYKRGMELKRFQGVRPDRWKSIDICRYREKAAVRRRQYCSSAYRFASDRPEASPSI